MSNRKLLFEIMAVHVVAWWGIRILSSHTSLLNSVVENTPQWYAVRLVRAIITVTIVLGWARRRKITWQELGLGKHGFWRNFAVAFGLIAFLWVTIVLVRGTPLVSPQPLDYATRFLAIVTSFLDVLAQQLPTFGLLQCLGEQLLPRAVAFGLAWLTFGLAHILIASPFMVIVVIVIGFFFGVSLWQSRNLGISLGVHTSFYFMLAILGWGA